MDIQAKIKALQKEKGVSKNQATAIAYAQKNSTAQQGKLIQSNLSNSEAKQANDITGINFNRQGIDQLFMTEKDYEMQSQAKFLAQKNLEAQRRLKITDITSETQSPLSNRRIWHSQKPEYYVGKEEVTEGNQYTTIPYSKWEAFKSSPEYLKYKNMPTTNGMAYNQMGGGYNYLNQPPISHPKFIPTTPMDKLRAGNQQQEGGYAQTGFAEGFGVGYNVNEQYAPNNSNVNQNQNSFNVPLPTFNYLPQMAEIASPKMITSQIEGTNRNTTITDQEKQQEKRYYPYGASYDIGTKIDYAGYNFGKGNNLMGTLGLVSAGLEGIRTGMGSYASAKESTRIAQENQNKLFKDERKYKLSQQGGKITNAEMLTDQYITDEGEGNINMEDSEFVKRAESGDVQKVVGEKHIENGKKAPGVNATLNEGDKVLSDYTKIPVKNIKELKERYDLTLKKGATFADAQKMFDRKIGITKLTDELATTIEKLDDNETIKDATTKRLNELVLAKKIKEKTEIINMLKDPQSMIFEDLFGMQEDVPKLGDGSVLFDKKGKPIKEDENIAQQGGYKQIQQEETERNIRGYQQGGIMDIASKYGISEERAIELVGMQQGGMIKRADGSYSKRGLWDNVRANKGSGKKPTKQMLEQERKINKNRQEGGQEMNSEQGQQMSMEQQSQNQMQQVFQAIAQMMQEQLPPQEIAQNLVKMGVPQEQVGDLISQVAEQLNQQAPQQQDEEQMAMQEGGGIPESYRNKGFTKVGVKRDSNRPGKKWMVLAKKGTNYKIVHGGAIGMKDFSQHGSEERKKRFWDRMGGKDSAKAKDPFSPLYWHNKGFSNSKSTW